MGAAVRILSFLLASGAAWSQPTLEEILARLAANQEVAVETRKTIVYRQDTWVRLLRTNGQLSREEKRRYTVAPTANGTEKKLDHFEGRYERAGKIHTYDHPKFQYKDTDIDGDLIEDLTGDLVNDSKSRDGLARSMFPLTRDEQRHYRFTLKGRKQVAGVEAWRLEFEPLKGSGLDSDRPWKGEVYVHPEEYQPLLVSTMQAFRVPLAVKVLLGSDVRQSGFQVTYRKVGEGLWFPVAYGTEFSLKVLFGYKRNITMNVTNSEFRRTSAESTIRFEDLAAPW